MKDETLAKLINSTLKPNERYLILISDTDGMLLRSSGTMDVSLAGNACVTFLGHIARMDMDVNTHSINND